jgi:transcriptional regulator with XRE-family HTH domain
MGRDLVNGGSLPRSLGELIAQERKRRSLSRRKLAEMVRQAARAAGEKNCGTNERTVLRWESAETIPRSDALHWLAAALGQHVERLTSLA